MPIAHHMHQIPIVTLYFLCTCKFKCDPFVSCKEGYEYVFTYVQIYRKVLIIIGERKKREIKMYAFTRQCRQDNIHFNKPLISGSCGQIVQFSNISALYYFQLYTNIFKPSVNNDEILTQDSSSRQNYLLTLIQLWSLKMKSIRF